MPKLTKLLVESTKAEKKDLILWDSELKGFGLRVKPSGVKTFVVQYRTGKGRKWPTKRVTIGQFGPLTIEQARKSAREQLASVILGGDPRAERNAAAQALTVGELCDEYFRAATVGSLVTRRGKQKASSTLAIDWSRINRHIKPLLGSKRARDLTTTDVRKMFEAVAAGDTRVDEVTGRKRGRAIVTGGKGTAKKAVTLLRAILTFGVRENHVAKNVAAEVPLPADGRRYVESPEQLFRDLGEALAAAESRGETWQAVAIVRLLALTGMRRDEAVSLDWSEVDFSLPALRLRDSKTGDSVRPLGNDAFRLLYDLSIATHAPRPLIGPVFSAPRRESGSYGGLPGAWERIKKSPDLDADTLRRLAPYSPHHFRHAVVTFANRLGFSDATAGKIVGHKAEGSTARYISFGMDEVLFSAADRLVSQIKAKMDLGARAFWRKWHDAQEPLEHAEPIEPAKPSHERYFVGAAKG